MYSGYRRADPRFAYGALTLSGWLSQSHSATLIGRSRGPNPSALRALVWAPPVSLAATPGIDLSFSSSGYLGVSVHRVPLRALCVHARMAEVFSAGFPHSDTCGSMGICPSPQLFAAYHVFHRLLVPRHPPCALLRLTFAHIALCAGRACMPSGMPGSLLLFLASLFLPRMSCDSPRSPVYCRIFDSVCSFQGT